MSKFSGFLQEDFRNLVENKIKDSALSGDKALAEYTETLITKGVDLSYTLAVRGAETSSDNVEDIVNAAVSLVIQEVDGIAASIVEGKEPGKLPKFKRKKDIKVTKRGTAFRSRSGKFIGALKLASLLNIMINVKATQIMKNSKYGNILRYRTGRLANSANVTSVNFQRGSIHFNYMYYPYQVFEPGGRLYKDGRDPRDIFANAIAESLSELLSAKDLAASKFAIYRGRERHGTVSNGRFVSR